MTTSGSWSPPLVLKALTCNALQWPRSGLPAAAVRVITVAELPLLPSGKPDYQAIRDLARRTDEPTVSSGDLRALFADVLQIDARTIRPDQSFVDLGGNSLSYVAMSVRLERALGRLPSDWQRRPLRRTGAHHAPCPPVVAVARRDVGDQRRAARRGHRVDRRLARHALRDVGRRAPPARNRGLQLRPVLSDARCCARTGFATCARRSPGSSCPR